MRQPRRFGLEGPKGDFESMRRPRAGFVTPHSVGLGSRSGGITTAPRGASLDWDWARCPRPRKRGPGDRNRRKWSAERRPSVAQTEGTRLARRVGPPRRPLKGSRKPLRYLGAPLPSGECMTEDRRTRRLDKNTGDDACALHPPLEGEGREQRAKRDASGVGELFDIEDHPTPLAALATLPLQGRVTRGIRPAPYQAFRNDAAPVPAMRPNTAPDIRPEPPG